jgi:hypothetical protein
LACEVSDRMNHASCFSTGRRNMQWNGHVTV